VKKKERWGRLLLVLLGLVLGAVLIELGMRAAGLVAVRLQERENRESLAGRESFVILCLGESTTALGGEDSYPRQLEKILDRELEGRRVAVVNKGVPGTNTAMILAELEENLDRYRPDLVVAMMGINDGRGDVFCPVPGEESGFFSDLRIVKLGRWLRCRMFGAPPAGPGNPAGGRRPRNWEKYAARCARMGRSAEAAAAYARVLETNPGDPGILAERGAALAAAGDRAGAARSFRAAAARASDPVSVLLRAAEAADKSGYPGAAERLLDRALASAPDSAPAWFQKDFFLIGRGRWREAAEVRERGVELDPAGGYDHLLAAADELGLRRLYGLKRAALERAAALDPGRPDAFLVLAEGLRRNRDLGGAEELVGRALAVDPACPRAWKEMGRIRQLQGKPEEALRCYRTAFEADPFSSLHAYVFALLARGSGDEAVAVLEEVRRRYPANPAVLRLLAACHTALGDEEEARACSSLALESRSGGLNAAMVRNYRRLREIVRGRGIPLICMQYPMRPLSRLEAAVGGAAPGVVFVDNEASFREGMARHGFEYYFWDQFGGNFGHATAEGNRMLAENAARAILPLIAP